MTAPAMTWTPDLSRILTHEEQRLVLADLDRRRRSVNARQNRAVFLLAVGCGLRASEIADLELRDVRADVAQPTVEVRCGKGGKGRRVPLIDPRALEALRAWKAERLEQGAKRTDPFVCTLSKQSTGARLHRSSIRARFRNACKALGEERLERLTVHDGRHTFASYAVQAKGLAWARDALGHSSVHTTSIYSHATDRHAPANIVAPANAAEDLDDLAALRAELAAMRAKLEALEGRGA